MKSKLQLNSSTSNKKDARTFKTVVSAIEQCLLKPPYDYQRIILCHSKRPELAPALALCSGATLFTPADSLPSVCAPSVHIVENADQSEVKTLKSIICIINQTRSVVVLIASVRAVGQWEKSRKEIWAQIRRRTHLSFKFEI